MMSIDFGEISKVVVLLMSDDDATISAVTQAVFIVV
jgi:hypothetical protein